MLFRSVSEEHDSDTDGHALAVSDLIGENTAEERHEIYSGKEDRIDLSCRCYGLVDYYYGK